LFLPIVVVLVVVVLSMTIITSVIPRWDEVGHRGAAAEGQLVPQVLVARRWR
jgi:competence protein ComGC